MTKKNNHFDICIIGGLGHVGLPLGIYLSEKKLKVCCYDNNKPLLEKVEKGFMPYIEKNSENLLKKNIKNGNLSFSIEPNSISSSENIIIAIGTPVDEFLNPQISDFLQTIKKLKPYFKKDQLVIVRSSVFPKTCHKILKILEDCPNLDLAYCPERIVQGFAFSELEKLPQIIAGFSDVAKKRAGKLFKLITKKIIYTSIGEAELMKLFSNSWRYIQFAVANQFFMIANDYEEDFDRIRKIMMQDYDRASGLPSAGFAAGPCLLKDTMQLSSFYNNNFLLGQAAMNINEGLPNYIINDLKKNNKLVNKNIGILGMSFKANIDDTRGSLSYKIKKSLIFEGANVLCSDPYVKDNNFYKANEIIDKCQIIIIGAPHSEYKKLIFKGNKLIDIWNIIKS